MFDDKILLITGGTGSFGNAVMKRFLDSNIKEIRIFSRDEKKQDDIRSNPSGKAVPTMTSSIIFLLNFPSIRFNTPCNTLAATSSGLSWNNAPCFAFAAAERP